MQNQRKTTTVFNIVLTKIYTVNGCFEVLKHSVHSFFIDFAHFFCISTALSMKPQNEQIYLQLLETDITLRYGCSARHALQILWPRCSFDLISLTLITGCKLANSNSIFVLLSALPLVSHFHRIYIEFSCSSVC